MNRTVAPQAPQPGPSTTATARPSVLAALAAAGMGQDEVRARTIDRLAYAHDASHYLLTPQAVVLPTSATDVARLFRVSAQCGMSLTFRSGGTSLSGQGVTDGLLADVRRHFRGIEILDDGARVRVQPGATVRAVNTRLAPWGRKLGPDPASEAACTLGGVIANNSSGMACGTQQNAYQTLESLVLVLPSGTVVDTADHDADARLAAQEPVLYQGLARLRDRVRSNAESVRTIERQFSMKNTMGYGLNAFLDHEAPVKILEHLIVGSEGTLAFVAQATLRTVPLHPHAATGLLVFDTLADAMGSLPGLVGTRPSTVELLDAASLRVAQRDPRAGTVLRSLDVSAQAALLVEYAAPTAGELEETLATQSPTLDEIQPGAAVAFTTRAAARADLWHIRKGLYAAVAGARPAGTIALLEDVVVPVPALLPTCSALSELFSSYHYNDAVIFGHAKDGNVHFMLTDRFERPDQLEHYRRFTEEMVDLVLGMGGSLKAEHGTGRNMAPYVARQYGPELYDVMRELKSLCDPAGLLNPGVILNDDAQAHLRHLKVTPVVEPEVDRCVECGYCEPVCPSRDLTTTPRQRIALRREMARAELQGDQVLLRELEEAFEYDGVQTCAVDGMCQTACPVSINTGDLVKRLRGQGHGPVAERVGAAGARHWRATTAAAATMLDVAHRLPPSLPVATTTVARRLLGTERVPAWTPDLPSGGTSRARTDTDPDHQRHTGGSADAVYLASCTGAMFGAAQGDAGVRAAFTELCGRAGIRLRTVTNGADLCCGTPWRSKGLHAGYDVMREKVVPALWQATDGGRLPVVSDASSCTEGLAQLVEDATTMDGGRYAALRVVDAVTFTVQELLPRLTVLRPLPSVALHPTCSSTRLGLNADLTRLAEAVADTVVTPAAWGCCGFAGDRGLLHPELTAAATAPEVAELDRQETTAHASCNRTCEIGMSRATGADYRHLVELLADATRPLPQPRTEGRR